MTSIVILNYNTPSLTIDCIESIKEHTYPGAYEIILVDNASRDDSVELFQNIPPEYNVRLIISDKNLGFAGGCNLGMKAAKGEEICLLNSDTLVTPKWLELLKNALYSSENIGMAGPVTNNASLQQISTPNFKTKQDIYDWGETYNKETPLNYIKASNLIFFCVLMKKEVYTRIGGLDENFFPGNYEDDDYSIRARLAGFKLIVAKNVFIFHYGSESFKKYRNREVPSYNEFMDIGRKRVIEKYGLSNFYKADFAIEVYKERKRIKKQLSRILLINTGASTIPYDLLNDYPSAEISVITSNFMDSLLLTPDFSSKWCENIEEDLFKSMDGKYDLMFLALDLANFKDWEKFITRLFDYLTKGGVVMLYANRELKSFTNE